jgi:two-component sensor histidine kinase
VSTLSSQLEGAMEMRRNDGTAFQLTFSELKYAERL